MRGLERGTRRESFDAAVASVARTYGFTNPPIVIPRKDAGASASRGAGLVAAAAAKAAPPAQAGGAAHEAHVWAVTKASGASAITFAISSPRHAIAQAFVVKAALGVAEAAGMTALAVLISSVGDHESRRRYFRELSNFFKKCAKDLPDDIRDLSMRDPDLAAEALAARGDPRAESLPRTIDFLSESSRKVMLETVSLFEALGIDYRLATRLSYDPALERELLFAIEGADRAGERLIIASGGRIVCEEKGAAPLEAVGMSVTVPRALDPRDIGEAGRPTCFVIHVGAAAKLKGFVLLDALWRSHIALEQAILATTIDEQMRRAAESGAPYAVIIGQREALDGTAIIRNIAMQTQETVPQDKVAQRLARVRSA